MIVRPTIIVDLKTRRKTSFETKCCYNYTSLVYLRQCGVNRIKRFLNCWSVFGIDNIVRKVFFIKGKSCLEINIIGNSLGNFLLSN